MSKQSRKKRTLETLIRTVVRQEIAVASSKPMSCILTRGELIKGVDDFFQSIYPEPVK